MKLHFWGDIKELSEGIKILQNRLGYKVCEEGLSVEVKQGGSGITVCKDRNGAVIEYKEKIHFFRGLGLLLEYMQSEETFTVCETPHFKTDGVMVDCSRNAVMTVKSVKKLLEYMAVMGLNMLMLYTEDTYEIKEYPYFGYMRGRYTKEELQTCDDYAFALGIEMVPCIQTLGHLFAALKWDMCGAPKDMEDILLVGDEQTYTFIENMICAATAPYRSNKIHIGMDEANGLGLGNYLKKNGYTPSFDLMCSHLNRVKQIAQQHGLEPMIWSDMFFQAVSKQHTYYDTEVTFTPELIAKVPKGVTLAYWDYQHEEQAHYEKMIARHRELGNDMLFAGAVLTWIGMAVNYDITFVAATAALKACLSQKVDRVIATLWGDDGAETNYFSALLGLQLYAEYGYRGDCVTNEWLNRRFKTCTGGSMEDFLAISKLDCIARHEREKVTDTSNPSKYLLFQDVLLGLFDKHIENYPISEYYAETAKRLAEAQARAGELRFVFDVPVLLARALVKKADIGVKLTRAYQNGDTQELKEYAQMLLPETRAAVEELRRTHRAQWLATYKPFGWEVLDLRYGGVLARIDTAIYRIEQYLSGEINKLEELEQTRLGFDMNPRPDNAGFGRGNTYQRIATACPTGLNR